MPLAWDFNIQANIESYFSFFKVIIEYIARSIPPICTGYIVSFMNKNENIADEGSSRVLIIEVVTGPMYLIAPYRSVRGIISQKNARQAAFCIDAIERIFSFGIKPGLKIKRTIREKIVVYKVITIGGTSSTIFSEYMFIKA